jgi:hypothetical protein
MMVIAVVLVGIMLMLLLKALRHGARARLTRQAALTIEALLLAEFHAAIRRLAAWQ